MRDYLITCVVVFFALIGFVSSIRQVQGQGAPKFEGRTFTHVGLVVHDVDKTVKTLGDIWGVEAPQVRVVSQIPYPPDFKGDRSAGVKVAQFQLDNIRFELLEPLGGPSPYKEWLTKHGDGVNHIAFTVKDIPESVRALESKGGTWVMGDATSTFGHVDMPSLGIFFELGRQQPPLAK
jgi:catechol 2,3-dioxygenase-like lactoylglutathione lyase family enzyme